MGEKERQEEKAIYEKPVLTKHGKLRDITALAGSSKTAIPG